MFAVCGVYSEVYTICGLGYGRYGVWCLVFRVLVGLVCGYWGVTGSMCTCLGFRCWWLSSVVYGVWFVVWCLDIGMYDVAFVLFIL